MAFEVAREPDVPPDVLVVRKLSAARQPEGVGAVGENGVREPRAPAKVADPARDRFTARLARPATGTPPRRSA
ncbi:hypothetical protein [Streptomyces sp. NPDC001401]|uniref:hypothetical protein n=1 Tax=Streptomyces sp. NPDC001401 TaxID=3364570 RepID=UPI00369CED0D